VNEKAAPSVAVFDGWEQRRHAQWPGIFFDLRTPIVDFPQLNVTSDLAHKKEKADHRHGEWGARASLQKSCNPFVVKILTSNPYALKILQTLFAKPAPVKAFQRDRGRGVPTSIPKFPKWSRARTHNSTQSENIFSPEFDRGFSFANLRALSGKSF
jgi:hypothetical protein